MNLRRVVTGTLLVGGLGLCGFGGTLGYGAHAMAKPPTGESAGPRKVEKLLALQGPEGMRVEVVDLTGDRALIRVTGVKNEVTGKVAEYERREQGRTLTYSTDWHGRGLVLLERSEYGWEIHLPLERDSIRLSYLEAQSRKVNAAEITSVHVAQTKSGELAALQRFDRAAEQAEHDKTLASDTARHTEPCGKPLPFAIQWDTVTDQGIKEYDISYFCGSFLSGLSSVCESEAGKRFVANNIDDMRCTLNGDNHMRIEGRTLHWAINFDLSDTTERITRELHSLKPKDASRTLGEQLLDDATFVCGDKGLAHVVIGGPREAPHGGLAYGNSKQLARVTTLPGGEHWFLDPRQRNEQHNPSSFGNDMRVYSRVVADPKRGVCEIQCGTRATELPLLTGDDKAKVVQQASYAPSLQTREPVALARDEGGVYYLVDRGIADQQDYRVYRGKPGQLRKLDVKEAIVDSGGAIFTTSEGRLQLPEYGSEAAWSNEKTTKLIELDASQNMSLIYTQLGIYSTKRLGVPCDDF